TVSARALMFLNACLPVLSSAEGTSGAPWPSPSRSPRVAPSWERIEGRLPQTPRSARWSERPYNLRHPVVTPRAADGRQKRAWGPNAMKSKPHLAHGCRSRSVLTDGGDDHGRVHVRQMPLALRLDDGRPREGREAAPAGPLARPAGGAA